MGLFDMLSPILPEVSTSMLHAFYITSSNLSGILKDIRQHDMKGCKK